MTHNYETTKPKPATLYPLYESRWEHDACGMGFLANVSGEANHSVVQTALEALARLTASVRMQKIEALDDYRILRFGNRDRVRPCSDPRTAERARTLDAAHDSNPQVS